MKTDSVFTNISCLFVIFAGRLSQPKKVDTNMNENWSEIVESLHSCFEKKTLESDYQHEIENCLKILGWKKSNNTMEAQYKMPIGNKKSIRPDLLLFKENKEGVLSPVLPVEIKRPYNIKNERQEIQLMSYMRQLRLNVGLYIGESIQLFYDVPNDVKSPINVFTVKIEKSDTNGAILCDLLMFCEFDSNKLETFCTEQFCKIQARDNLHQRLSDFLLTENAAKNIFDLLCDKFAAEGFDGIALNQELAHWTVSIHYEEKDLSIIPIPILETTVVTTPLSTKRSKDTTRFSFDNISYFRKGRFVLELIKHYIKEHPFITYDELEKRFPSYLHSKPIGVIRCLSDIKNKIEVKPDTEKRYFLEHSEIITLSDGTKIVVTNQWGTHFPKFLQVAKQLYNVTSDAPYDKKDTSI